MDPAQRQLCRVGVKPGPRNSVGDGQGLDPAQRQLCRVGVKPLRQVRRVGG